MTNDPVTPSKETGQLTSAVRQVATYVMEARGKRVAEATREATLKRIFDLLSAAGAGIGEPSVLAVRKAASKVLRTGDVPIWFSGSTGSAVAAAWANSAAASTLDLDDGNRLARGHPGAAVIPAAFAVAAETGSGLDDLIAAIVIGYEVGVTIGSARTSYGSTGTWSSYAVVATAAALRGTPRGVLEHALAIAGESAPNQLFSSAPPFSLPTPEGSDIKEGIPWSVVTGLLALELAEGGFTGPRNLLESELQYRMGNARPLGEAQHICSSYYKLYACCRHIHPPLDAILGLLEQHAIDAKTIDAIEVETYSGALRITNKIRPSTLIDAQYSIPYCLALAALVGRQALLPLTAKSLGNAEAETLASKVALKLDPELDKHFPARTLARVTVVCHGRRFTSEVTAPRGEGNDPLTWQELEAKFVAATRGVADESRQQRLLEAVKGLRMHGELGPLSACMAEPLITQDVLVCA